MKLRVAWIGRTKEAAIQSLTAEYLKRIGRYLAIEHTEYASESAMLRQLEKSPTTLVLLDSRGKQFSSEELAKFIDDHQTRGTASLTFAIGAADGWTEETRKAAAFQFSMGRITMAHEIARIVLLEQIYRAFTILKGHPYHSGH